MSVSIEMARKNEVEDNSSGDSFSNMNKALRRMLNTPPKPHKEKREAEASRPSEKKTKQSVHRPKERS